MKLIIAFPYKRRKTAYLIREKVTKAHPDIDITIIHHLHVLREQSNTNTIIFTDGLGIEPQHFYTKAQPMTCLTVLLYIPQKLQIRQKDCANWCSGIIPEYASHLLLDKITDIKGAVDKR